MEHTPWAGRHLADADARILARSAHARVLAVLGSTNAGKTCLLTSFFLQLASQQRDGFPYRFASSRSLQAWSTLVASAQRWSGAAGDDAVDHSPRATSGRYLHLGLRPAALADDRHIELLLTDVAGEDVRAWARDPVAVPLAFLDRVDGVLVVVDAAAIIGGFPASRAAATIVARAVEVASTRELPLAVVFTKMDLVDGDAPPRESCERTAWGALGAAATARPVWAAIDAGTEKLARLGVFPTSAFPHALDRAQPVGVMHPFRKLLADIERPRALTPFPTPVAAAARGLNTMRRWEVEP